eukprot:scaffold20221_cov80-Skeletonema_dohrnii-CCMP3373.AAC.2
MPISKSAPFTPLHFKNQKWLHCKGTAYQEDGIVQLVGGQEGTVGFCGGGWGVCVEGGGYGFGEEYQGKCTFVLWCANM